MMPASKLLIENDRSWMGDEDVELESAVLEFIEQLPTEGQSNESHLS